MTNEYINHIKTDTIDGRTHLIAENGYVMTDNKEFYSRHLILAIGEEIPTLTVITDDEYEAVLEQEQLSLEEGMING